MLKTESREEQARNTCSRAGYAHGGEITEAEDERKDKGLIKRAVRQHDTQLHSSSKSHVGRTKLKLAGGGMVHGEEPGARPDKKSRSGHKPAPVQIKIATGGGGGGQQEAMAAHQAGLQQGIQVGARAAAAKMAGAGGPPGMPPRPPMGGPPPPGMMPPSQAMPPGAPMAPPGAAGMRPPGIKTGGRVKRADGGSVRSSMREPGVVKGGTDEPYVRERA